MKLPPKVLAFFRAAGAKGGKVGGKMSLVTMTPAERSARARKASKAAAVTRTAKARKKAQR